MDAQYIFPEGAQLSAELRWLASQLAGTVLAEGTQTLTVDDAISIGAVLHAMARQAATMEARLAGRAPGDLLPFPVRHGPTPGGDAA